MDKENILKKIAEFEIKQEILNHIFVHDNYIGRDFVFVVVCLIKILPIMGNPIWLYVWTVVIALIKIIRANHFENNKTHIFADNMAKKILGDEYDEECHCCKHVFPGMTRIVSWM